MAGYYIPLVATPQIGGGGGGSGVLVVHSTFDESTEVETLDKTWQEIYDGIVAGMVMVMPTSYVDEGTDIAHEQLAFLREAFYDAQMAEKPYVVYVSDTDTTYKAATQNDYPANRGQ